MKFAVVASILVASASTVAAVPVSPLWEHGPPFAHPYRPGEAPSTVAPGTLLPTAAADERQGLSAVWMELLDRFRPWGKAVTSWRSLSGMPEAPQLGKHGYSHYRLHHPDAEHGMRDMHDSSVHGTHANSHPHSHVHYRPQDVAGGYEGSAEWLSAPSWSVSSEVWVGASEPASSFVARVWAPVSDVLEQPSVYASVMFLVAAMNLATIVLAIKYLDRSRRGLADDDEESAPAGPCACCHHSPDEKKP